MYHTLQYVINKLNALDGAVEDMTVAEIENEIVSAVNELEDILDGISEIQQNSDYIQETLRDLSTIV